MNKIIEVRKYVVIPATNGWIISFVDSKTGEQIQVVAPTSKFLAKFFGSLDKGRAMAAKQLKRPPAR